MFIMSIATPHRAHICFLAICGVIFFPRTDAQTLPPIVTNDNLTDAILGRQTFSAGELEDLDLNGDGAVDTADLIYFRRGLGPLPLGVNFEQFQTLVIEGDDPDPISITVAPGFNGVVNYYVEGTATSGEDFMPLSGTLTVDGSIATFDVAILEDVILEDTESIIVTLDAGSGYSIGTAQQHTYWIADNDELWFGALNIDGLVLDFTLELARAGATSTALMKSNGGFGIPSGDLAATAATATEGSFSVSLGPFPVLSADSGLDVTLSRNITLTGTVIDYRSKIQGNITDIVTVEPDPVTAVVKNQHLSQIIQGTFELIKKPSVVPIADSNLKTIP